MNKAFERIALIEGMVAAAFVSEEGRLLGWCANSVISPDNLCFIAVTCRGLLSANRAEQRPAEIGVVAFGSRTLVFRDGATGLFMAYLNSPTNDAVLKWLFEQVDPLLEAEGVRLE